jgi:hypothetical protein
MPIVESNPVVGANLTTSQRTVLLSMYAPWFIIPLIMTVDMGFRVQKFFVKGIQVDEVNKLK